MQHSEMPNVPDRILLGPGPSSASLRVLQSMMAPMIGYLDPDFLVILEEISGYLKRLFRTEEGATLAISGTGSAGMEAGINSLLEPGDTVIICSCGFFSGRMEDMALRVGAEVVKLTSEWGKPFPAELLASEMDNHVNVKLVAIVHAETSTGVLQPLEEISNITKEYGSMLMVDAVTSLGGSVVDVDGWGVDYCYSATQKCLGAPPGLAPAALSLRALDSIRSRKEKPKSWYLDLDLISGYWMDFVYHHTAPVSMLIGLREALKMVFEEGLDKRMARHRRNSNALRAGVQSMGLGLVVPREYSLDQITAIWIPEGIDDIQIRKGLLTQYKIEIGRGLGDFAGKVWRIGLMGDSSRSENVLGVLSALEVLLNDAGYEVEQGAGVSAASQSLAND